MRRRACWTGQPSWSLCAGFSGCRRRVRPGQLHVHTPTTERLLPGTQLPPSAQDCRAIAAVMPDMMLNMGDNLQHPYKSIT